MRIIELQGFSVRPDRAVEFQQWLIANQERIAGAYPEGSEFGGVYYAVFGTEKGAGDCFWMDIHDSYGALDRIAAITRDPQSEMVALNREFLEFVDTDRSAGWSKMLLKPVADLAVMNVPQS